MRSNLELRGLRGGLNIGPRSSPRGALRAVVREESESAIDHADSGARHREIANLQLSDPQSSNP
eukprot:12245963-Alexandrium_andersonii.AAC.1